MSPLPFLAACAARLDQTMMDMIKSLEIGTSIVEHYVNRLHTCYAAIIEEQRSEQVCRARLPHTPLLHALRISRSSHTLRWHCCCC